MLTLKSGEVLNLDAWVTIGSPKFAPELVNIVTLDDLMYDVGVRFYDLVPARYDRKKQARNTDYIANYERDIEPIIRRPMDSLWVANLPSMAPFFAPPFNQRDNSEANRKNRETYLGYFRRPGEPHNSPEGRDDPHSYNSLWSGDGKAATNVPMMPLQSGSNSVWDYVIGKFLTLTDTQYFLLSQWAAGKFSTEKSAAARPGVPPPSPCSSDGGLMPHYTDSLSRTFYQYLNLHRQYYLVEQRWPESPFWARRHRALHLHGQMNG
ncbi:MAG TPA: LodA/GoxA family CTQ-dependent oxidase [Pyrinomonadaceae bacterium]|nr:LodA/GoxA family CTQ-dependent oxidase [Pyrinomonadaceae bacterium]